MDHKKIKICIGVLCLLVLVLCTAYFFRPKSVNENKKVIQKNTESIENTASIESIENTENADNSLKLVEYKENQVVDKVDMWNSPEADIENISIKENIENAEEIIEGKVEDISYYSYQGVAWTKLKIKINRIFSGSLQENDEISVYVMGGYISYDDYLEYYFDKENNGENGKKLIQMTEIGNNMHKKGDIVVMTLEEADENSPFEEGAYERTASNNSEFIYDEDSEKYEVVQGGKEYLKNELYSKIKKLS